MKWATLLIALAISLIGYGAPYSYGAPNNSAENAGENGGASMLLEIIDNPANPLLEATLIEEKGSLIVRGSVRKRGEAGLNGFVSVKEVTRNGDIVWHDDAKLTSIGLRYFRYRTFESVLPRSIESNFSEVKSAVNGAPYKVILEFHPDNSDSGAQVSRSFPVTLNL